MSKYYYDLHIHSCLSPCADDDMTPNNICSMAVLCGLNIIALTDHNTCGNVEAFMKAAKKNGLIGIAGMELTTSEDIHIICLFEKQKNALLFSEEVQKHRLAFPNKVELYGKQMYMDENDCEIAVEENFLPLATTLGLDEAVNLAKCFDAVVYPAHIDRMANGIVSILGTIPEKPVFSCFEFNQDEDIEKYKSQFSAISSKQLLINSDAHHLWSINEAQNFIELEDEPYSSDLVRHKLFQKLKGSF